jgi:hypothetical protein
MMVIELVGGFQISWGLTNQNGNVIWIEWDIYIYYLVGGLEHEFYFPQELG